MTETKLISMPNISPNHATHISNTISLYIDTAFLDTLKICYTCFYLSSYIILRCLQRLINSFILFTQL